LEVPPLTYEILKYSLDTGEGYKQNQVTPFGFDGLFENNAVADES
jgi:hypothetical protein